MHPDLDIQKQLEHLDRYGIIRKDTSPSQDKHQHKKRKVTKRTSSVIETPVDSELDLHGLTLNEARAAVELEIECLRKARLKTLRIIHGGNLNKKVPMRKEIERLIRGPLKKLIRNSYRDHYNFGSIIIVLNSSL